MKKVILMVAVLAVSANAFGVITGSAHDFSDDSIIAAGGEICAPCHVPHNPDSANANAPLWNHEESVFITYTLYTNAATLTATDVAQPSGVSKLCLSCHDGTVALDSFGGATGSNALISGDAGFVGTDLSLSHPVSFTYDTTLAGADGGLFDPSTDTTSLGDTIANDLLFSGELECASCHDVHNAQDNTSLLVIDNANSALCLTCHNK